MRRSVIATAALLSIGAAALVAQIMAAHVAVAQTQDALDALDPSSRDLIEIACAGPRLSGDRTAYEECLQSEMDALAEADGLPDLSARTPLIRELLEAACAVERYAGDTGAYATCLRAQVAAYDATEGLPDLSNLDPFSRELIENACGAARAAGGPIEYGACLNEQIAALGEAGGVADVSGYPLEAREIMESACVTERAIAGPVGYAKCLEAQIASYEASPGMPDLEAFERRDRAALRDACRDQRFSGDVALYAECLQTELAVLIETRPEIAAAATLSALEPRRREAIEDACFSARASGDGAEYEACVMAQLEGGATETAAAEPPSTEIPQADAPLAGVEPLEADAPEIAALEPAPTEATLVAPQAEAPRVDPDVATLSLDAPSAEPTLNIQSETASLEGAPAAPIDPSIAAAVETDQQPDVDVAAAVAPAPANPEPVTLPSSAAPAVLAEIIALSPPAIAETPDIDTAAASPPQAPVFSEPIGPVLAALSDGIGFDANAPDIADTIPPLASFEPPYSRAPVSLDGLAVVWIEPASERLADAPDAQVAATTSAPTALAPATPIGLNVSELDRAPADAEGVDTPPTISEVLGQTGPIVAAAPALPETSPDAPPTSLALSTVAPSAAPSISEGALAGPAVSPDSQSQAEPLSPALPPLEPLPEGETDVLNETTEPEAATALEELALATPPLATPSLEPLPPATDPADDAGSDEIAALLAPRPTLRPVRAQEAPAPSPRTLTESPTPTRRPVPAGAAPVAELEPEAAPQETAPVEASATSITPTPIIDDPTPVAAATTPTAPPAEAPAAVEEPASDPQPALDAIVDAVEEAVQSAVETVVPSSPAPADAPADTPAETAAAPAPGADAPIPGPGAPPTNLGTFAVPQGLSGQPVQPAPLPDDLGTDGLILLGVLSGGARDRALLGTADGGALRVETGDVIDGWTVGSIGEDFIRLTRGTQTRFLRLP